MYAWAWVRELHSCRVPVIRVHSLVFAAPRVQRVYRKFMNIGTTRALEFSSPLLRVPFSSIAADRVFFLYAMILRERENQGMATGV